MSDENEIIAKAIKGFDKLEDSCCPGVDFETDKIPPIRVQWSAKGKGFGEFWFFYKEDENGNEVLHLDNECENRAFVKKMLCQMVDDAVLTDIPWRNEDGTLNDDA